MLPDDFMESGVELIFDEVDKAATSATAPFANGVKFNASHEDRVMAVRCSALEA